MSRKPTNRAASLSLSTGEDRGEGGRNTDLHTLLTRSVPLAFFRG